MLHARFVRDGDVFTVAGRGLYVAGPAQAKAVLGNAEADFVEHSDFFYTTAGVLGPREVQQRIAREARLMLAAFVAGHRQWLPDLVDRWLRPSSELPDAANRLLFDLFGPVLLDERGTPALRAAIADVVEYAVLAGARARRTRWQRARLRGRTHRLLAAEIAARRRAGAPGSDLLDVVAQATDGTHSPLRAAEVWLSLLFATVGSVGFHLSWSLYLLATQPDANGHAPSAVAREALRLWPVAWLFGRVAARPHRIGDHGVQPGQLVTVCTYLLHRHPGHWPQPQQFRPDRWAATGHPAFIPFGWGQHACTGAALALDLVADLLRVTCTGYRPVVAAHDPQPQVGAALAPPRFALRLQPVT